MPETIAPPRVQLEIKVERPRLHKVMLDHGKDSSGILTHRRCLAEWVQHAAAAACGLCTKPL